MITILLQTQYKENYGDDVHPHWKFKGGEEYLFTCDIKLNEFLHKNASMVVDELLQYIEYSNQFAQEFVTGWEIVDSDYKTDFEKAQLEYEGEILYPAKRHDVDEFIKMCKEQLNAYDL